MSLRNAGFDFSRAGTQRYLRELENFDEKIRKKMLTSAVRKGASHLRKISVRAAKKLDNKDTPNKIYKNIGIQFASNSLRKNGNFFVRVGVLGGALPPTQQNTTVQRDARGRAKRVQRVYATGGKGGETWYWRFLELGTNRTRRKSFLYTSLLSSQNQIATIVTNDLKQRIQRGV